MSDATLLIKRMPSELKQWLADEAARNARSMNKEAIRLLEEARALREAAIRPARDTQAIARILKDLQSMPVLDTRTMDDALYDQTGMPK
jgi:Arc-like DNA binding domain